MPIDNTEESGRGAALKILADILGRGGYSNIALRRGLDARADMPRERRAFITECVNTTLRRLLTLDYIINAVASVKTDDMDPLILNLLRMSVCQIAFMDGEPEYAVCDEAVKLAVTSGRGHFKGFVNGVLRNIIRRLPAITASIERLTGADYLEVKHSCPKAVINWLTPYLGAGETAKMLEYINENRPTVTVCVNTLKTDADTLRGMFRKIGAEALPALFPELRPWALRVSGMPGITGMKAYKDGFFHVMDESAMLAVLAAGLKPGMKALDACAAPGGKAFLAAYMMGDAGEIVAGDIHEHKVKLTKDGAERLGLRSVRAGLRDAAAVFPDQENLYDVVFADVPCSGLGLIGKRPDIRYNFSGAEVSKLQGLQRRILTASMKYLKTGGVLVYSTCTLTPEENEKNILWATKHTKNTKDPKASLLWERRILPHREGTDGFYIAKLTKE
ncbi:MAG: 16S rRNA (cytosine(967)-C(5))-methyltransferase RsmB [Clostridiales bacterium]|nr:16S rRNA (cytosine(967)-C(5))-methyltransferase RsmB [Clostridiales bacterium]